MDQPHWVPERETGDEVSRRELSLERDCLCAYLHPDNDGIEVQHRLPIFSEDIQADVAFQIDVGMIDLLGAFDLGWIVREVLVDGEVEDEAAALVHAFIRFDGESEVEDVVGVGKGGLHGRSQGQFAEI